MCYNYEALVRKGIKRSIRDSGLEHTISNLSEQEKNILKDFSLDPISVKLNNESSNNEEAESQSTFPGAECQVIPITTKQPEYYFFGFLPDWATSVDDERKSFNARADSIRHKPMWKKAWNNKQRCLIVTTGFYETDRATKKRYFFSVKGQNIIHFAGIYNHWKDSNTGQIKKTFAIITTEPNELVSAVHNRMPVILDAEGKITWLKPNASEETVYNLLTAFPAEKMEMKETPPPPRKKKGGTELNLDF